MENLLLCSRALYDKDLLDKKREIEELKNKIKKMQRNICSHNYKDESDQRYYPWVDSDCGAGDNLHYCLYCKLQKCDHLISDKQETIARCPWCSIFSVILNATEEEKSLKICDVCYFIKEKRHALDTTCICCPKCKKVTRNDLDNFGHEERCKCEDT